MRCIQTKKSALFGCIFFKNIFKVEKALQLVWLLNGLHLF